MVALVGLCCDGGRHSRVVSDLDRPNRHGLGPPESYRNSLGRAADPCEPRRGLSRVPTANERILPLVSSSLVVNAEHSCYRDCVLAAGLLVSAIALKVEGMNILEKNTPLQRERK